MSGKSEEEEDDVAKEGGRTRRFLVGLSGVSAVVALFFSMVALT